MPGLASLLVLVLMLTVGVLGGAAEAAVGDVIQFVDIPTTAQCGTSSGSAVAVVPGGKLSFPKFQTLLVTSCVVSGQIKLFFLDPSTNPATLVSTLNTILPTGVTLDVGWESLAFRSDKVDLIGCGRMSGTPKILSIDFSNISPNTTADGTAVSLFTGPSGSTCQGLAWDISSNPRTIYQSSSGATNPTVLHLSEAGGSIAGSVPSGCAGSMTGVAVGVVSAETPPFSGSVLFVACPQFGVTSAAIRQIKRADGTPVSSTELPLASFASPTQAPGDVECDPVTFGISQSWHPTIRNKDVLWVKDTDPLNPNKVYAMELPFAACGPVPPPPTSVANVCNLSIDTDGDGLPDCWETGSWWADGFPGIALDGIYTPGRTATSTNRFPLCTPFPPVNVATDCANPLIRDIFVEIDYMQFHQPNADAVSDVVAAFATAAPAFAANSGKCDGAGCTAGVRLHVQVDEQITHVDNTALFPCTGPKGGSDADFDAIKAAQFGTLTQRGLANAINVLNAKRLAFHYGLFVHNQSPTPPATTNGSSGCAELFGNDFMVSMGSWTPPNPAIAAHPGGVGSRSEQAGTFLHELGHNLGLRHGGIDNVNCKPHHVSVMNYAYQFPNSVPSRPLSYSPFVLGDPNAPLTCGLVGGPTGLGLNEGCLNENAGVGPLYTGQIAFGPLVGVPPKPTLAVAGGPINWNKNSVSTDVNVSRDLSGMTSSGNGCPASTTRDFLEGSNDWALLQLNMRASTDFADGISANFDPSVDRGSFDIPVESALQLSGDLIDIKPADPNNTVKVMSSANINVAIFSRQGIDATTIDPMSLALRGLPPGPAWVVRVKRGSDCKTQDVNKDGMLDLVCQFNFDVSTPTTVGTQKAALTGTIPPSTALPSGYDFHSSDVINFVP
jgi:hypothetical protein